MRRSPLVLAVLLGCSAVTPASAFSGVAYQGEARATDSGNLMYEEHHYVRTEEGKPAERIVLYRCPNGEPFARKKVSYGEPPYAPQFRMEDARFAYSEGFERGKIAGETFVQRGASEPLQKESIALGESLVVDAGFDEFVRTHWDELQAGKAVELRFLVPSRLAAYGFKVKKTGEDALYGDTVSNFELALSGLFGWFADPIQVSYRSSDRRLMRFVGLSNIRATPEENLIASIEFPPIRESAALDETTWDLAQNEKLSDCTVGQ